MTSAFRAMIAATAEQKGHPPEVVEAMVDRDVEIPDLIEKGKLLTLTNNGAVEAGLSEGTVRSEEHTSELQSHSFSSYAAFCLKKKIFSLPFL